jgi:hypothetical protein
MVLEAQEKRYDGAYRQNEPKNFLQFKRSRLATQHPFTSPTMLRLIESRKCLHPPSTCSKLKF